MENGVEKHLTVRQLVKDNAKDLLLTVVSGRGGLERMIQVKDLNFPGLALTGFMDLFHHDRVQLFGSSEIAFLTAQTREVRLATLEKLFSHPVPCMFVSNHNRTPREMVQLSEKYEIPVISSNYSTTDLSFLLSTYLNDKFAPALTINGTLVDVFGTGLLFIGRPGIGKSEIALDLVERGHRLIGDDYIRLIRKPPGILVGTGAELGRGLIEIRGVGIINVRKMYGVRAIRIQKRVETIVELTDWKDSEDYDRLGLEENWGEYLGLKVPLVRLPVYPGKNITVISETIALNLHLKVYGENAAQELSRLIRARQKSRERDKQRLAKYLSADDE